MSLLRHVQFLRNSTAYGSLDLAVAGLKAQLANLKDGELVIGRYTVTSGEQTDYHAVLGVARVVGDNKSMDFFYCQDEINNIIDKLDVTGYQQASFDSTSKKLIIYGIKEVNGKIEHDATADKEIDLSTALSGLDATNVQSMTQSTDANGNVTLTFKGTSETDGIIAQGTGSGTLVLKKVATTGKAEDVSVAVNDGVITATNVKDALVEIAKEIDGMDLTSSAIVTLTNNGTTVNASNIKEADGKVTVEAASKLFEFNQEVSDTNKVATMADVTAASHHTTVSDETANAVSVAKTDATDDTGADYKVTLGIDATDKVLTQSAAGLLANITLAYEDVTTGEGENATTYKAIKLIGKDNTVISTINATDFIKDGMLSSAELVTDPDGQTAGTYIKLTWNTDADKEAMYINVTSLIDIYTGDDYITVDTYSITHNASGVTAGSYGVTENKTVNDYSDTAVVIDVPSIKVDAAGHVTAAANHKLSINIPKQNLYSTIAANEGTSATASSATDTLKIAGTTANDNMIQTTVKQEGTATTVEVTHKEATITTTAGTGVNVDFSSTTTGEGENQTTTTNNKVVVPNLTFDKYGHVTNNGTTTYTITIPAAVSYKGGDGITISNAVDNEKTVSVDLAEKAAVASTTSDAPSTTASTTAPNLLGIVGNQLTISDTWDCGTF